jgi:cytoskeletal protein CcmA (bactofilin family)
MKNGNGDKQVPNIIAQGTNIIGDIHSEGDFRIEGSIVGKIDAKGRIVVGVSGNVDGEITCSDADICGKVVGKLDVRNLTMFKATAVFSGDVKTKKISIEPGAEFTGNCAMGSTEITDKNK